MRNETGRRLPRDLVARPLTPDRWDDFVSLFGPRGACGGCWCMWWRETHAEFERLKGDGNRKAMRRIVSSGEVPGIIGYVEDEPVAWCAVAPRERFSRLERSRILKRVDSKPVWSVVCFFIAKPYRKLGLSRRMLEEAVRHAGAGGAETVEGYPVEPKKGSTADVFAYTGLARVFRSAGFTEVARRSETRPIMRRPAEDAGRPDAGRASRGRGKGGR